MMRSKLLKAFALSAAQLVSKSADKLIDILGTPANAFAQTLKNPTAAVLFGAGSSVICMKGITAATAALLLVPAVTFAANLADSYTESAARRQKPAYDRLDYRVTSQPDP